jgi:hypothetical protein
MQLSITRWTIAHDSEATRACYAQIPEEWQCAPCQSCENHLAMRQNHLPPAFWKLLDTLAITFVKPAEIDFAQPGAGANVQNGVWYHFVGRIVSGADVWKPRDENGASWDGEEIAPGVSFGFSSRRDLLSDAFAGQSIVQLAFQLEIPWVLDPDLHPY